MDLINKIKRVSSILVISIFISMLGCNGGFVYNGQLSVWSEQDQVYINSSGKIVASIDETTDGKHSGVIELHIIEKVDGSSLNQEKYIFQVSEVDCTQDSCGHYVSPSGEHIPFTESSILLVGASEADPSVTVTAVGRKTSQGFLSYHQAIVYFQKNELVIGVFKGTVTVNHAPHSM